VTALFILLVIAGVGYAVWYFFIKKPPAPPVPDVTTPVVDDLPKPPKNPKSPIP
jgi:hypothetical protein